MAAPDDPFTGQDKGIQGGSKNWVTITPNDGTDLTFYPRAIAVGATAGPVVLTGLDGTDATFYFNAGEIKFLRPVRVKATGTTATPIIGLK